MTFAQTAVENLCKWLGCHRPPHCMGCVSLTNFQNEERERAARIAEMMTIPGHSVAAPLAAEIAKKIRGSEIKRKGEA